MSKGCRFCMYESLSEETLFWTEEVESELNRWEDEKFKLAEVCRITSFRGHEMKIFIAV